MPTMPDAIFDLFDRFGDDSYGEAVTQRAHALQCAALARADGAPDTLVAAALLHDIGQFLDGAGQQAELAGTDGQHELRGAILLRPYYPEAVIAPIAMHVDAKRYLCAVEPEYLAGVSAASALSLRLQGGPFNADEVRAFEAHPHFDAAIRLRRYDDTGKTVDLDVRPLDEYRGLLASLLLH